MILVTGGTGFIGLGILERLVKDGLHDIRAAVRRPDAMVPPGVGKVVVVDLAPDTDWASALNGIEVVIHAAARVHVMLENAANPLAEFRRVNVEGSINLARQAAQAGVRRFVFVSSVKVNGESTQSGYQFTADDAPAPLDAYGVSKMEAEQGLLALSAQTGMEVVIIRPPLVYGSGVKANFAAMVRWLRRGVPLPLGAIHNQRSLVALDNLVDLMVTCITHPAAAGQIFLVSDGEDVSTTELLRRLGQAMGRPARLLPVPVSLLKLAAAMVGKQDMAERLCGSLQVDMEKTRRLLGWCPPLTLDQGLKKAAEGYVRETAV